MNDHFGMLGIELKWVESYLTDREQVCLVNGYTSPMKILCGVPQGSILGLLLFLLYIDDVPDYLETTTPCFYADDTQIFSSSCEFDTLVENLNSDLNNIQNWLAKNKLQHLPNQNLCLVGHYIISTIRSVTVLFY